MLRLAKAIVFSTVAFLALAASSAQAVTILPGLLVSDTDGDAVKLFDVNQADPNARFVGVFTKNAAGTAPDSGLIRPFGMAYGPNGHLYVGSLGTAQIREYDGTTGQFIRVAANNAGYVNSLAFGPDGNLYYSSYRETIAGADTGAVMKLNISTGATSVFASTGGLNGPTGIAFDNNGDLFVASSKTASSLNGSILQYNGLTGAFKGVYVSSLVGGLVAPAQITFGPPNPFNPSQRPDLYVTSFFGSNANAVTKFDGNGAFSNIAAFGAGIQNPGGVAYGDNGLLYVTGYGTKGVYRYDPVTGLSVDGGAFISSNSTNGLTGPTYALFQPNGGGAQNITPVPEPGSIALLAFGVVGLVGYQGWRRRQAQVSTEV